jgi:hypothetical protein
MRVAGIREIGEQVHLNGMKWYGTNGDLVFLEMG